MSCRTKRAYQDVTDMPFVVELVGNHLVDCVSAYVAHVVVAGRRRERRKRSASRSDLPATTGGGWCYVGEGAAFSDADGVSTR